MINIFILWWYKYSYLYQKPSNAHVAKMASALKDKSHQCYKPSQVLSRCDSDYESLSCRYWQHKSSCQADATRHFKVCEGLPSGPALDRVDETRIENEKFILLYRSGPSRCPLSNWSSVVEDGKSAISIRHHLPTVPPLSSTLTSPRTNSPIPDQSDASPSSYGNLLCHHPFPRGLLRFLRSAMNQSLSLLNSSADVSTSSSVSENGGEYLRYHHLCEDELP